MITLVLCVVVFYFLLPKEKTVYTKKVRKEKRVKVKEIRSFKEKSNLKTRQEPRVIKKKIVIQDDESHQLDEDGNLFITKVMNDGEYLTFQGDLLLGRTKDLESLRLKRHLKLSRPKKWTKGIIPFVIEKALTNRDEIIKTIKYFEENTNVRFKRRKDELDYLLFTSGKVNCYSAFGRTGGEQLITLSPSCAKREIVHEIMHTVGFLHEHSREDRDEFIEILWRNIAKDNQVQFKKVPNRFIDLTKRKFDYNSIMLYPSTAFSMYPGESSIVKNDGDLIHSRYGFLSEEDILRVNTLYPFKND